MGGKISELCGNGGMGTDLNAIEGMLAVTKLGTLIVGFPCKIPSQCLFLKNNIWYRSFMVLEPHFFYVSTPKL